MDLEWRNPLDEFTLRFLIAQLTNDRENYLRMAREVKGIVKGEDHAEESFMLRAEECGRIVQQLKKQLERSMSLPPPSPKVNESRFPAPKHKKWP